ncbi:uncharacterized protein DS421_18g615090 [Arachis hypogaea]|nr:uncharacterized protein DS421_18g615090 [Arachis hypogaea]
MVCFCFLVDQRRKVRRSKPVAGSCSRCGRGASVADIITQTRGKPPNQIFDGGKAEQGAGVGRRVDEDSLEDYDSAENSSKKDTPSEVGTYYRWFLESKQTSPLTF